MSANNTAGQRALQVGKQLVERMATETSKQALRVTQQVNKAVEDFALGHERELLARDCLLSQALRYLNKDSSPMVLIAALVAARNRVTASPINQFDFLAADEIKALAAAYQVTTVADLIKLSASQIDALSTLNHKQRHAIFAFVDSLGLSFGTTVTKPETSKAAPKPASSKRVRPKARP